jgi:SAM-dependent methyltransferase
MNKTSPSTLLPSLFFESKDFRIIDKMHFMSSDVPYWHFLMLADKERLEYYRDIIAPAVKDKIVLDIGSGTGILSFLALKFGAKRVYSIEQDPKLIGMYAATMEPHILAGKAVLVRKDAHLLERSDLNNETPGIILHEIFSTDLFSESVSSVFSALKAKGFLDNVKIIPSHCDILIEPVVCKDEDYNFSFEDFEGFPLKALDPFKAWHKTQHRWRDAPHWVSAGEEKVLFTYDLMKPDLLEIPEILIHCEEHVTHLRSSLTLRDSATGLSHHTSHKMTKSHWGNIFFSIPQWHRGKENRVRFKVERNYLELKEIVAASGRSAT